MLTHFVFGCAVLWWLMYKSVSLLYHCQCHGTSAPHTVRLEAGKTIVGHKCCVTTRCWSPCLIPALCPQLWAHVWWGLDSWVTDSRKLFCCSCQPRWLHSQWWKHQKSAHFTGRSPVYLTFAQTLLCAPWLFIPVYLIPNVFMCLKKNANIILVAF